VPKLPVVTAKLYDLHRRTRERIQTVKEEEVQELLTNTFQIIRADRRHFSDEGWLKTYWLFSFSDYFDPENVEFGALRVFNDDIIAPGTGFPPHTHQDFEIVTIVLSGEITHEDSMGNRTVVKAGDVQRMSAGTGVTHSEYNLGTTPLHSYQIWIFPNVRGLKPSYDQRSYSPESRRNRLLPAASGRRLPDVVGMYADATIYMTDLDAGQTLEFNTDETRCIFVYLTAGDMSINGERLKSHDQARITKKSSLTLQTHDATSLVLIDVPIRERHNR